MLYAVLPPRWYIPPAVTIVLDGSTHAIVVSLCVTPVARKVRDDWTLVVSVKTTRYQVSVMASNVRLRSKIRFVGFMTTPRTISFAMSGNDSFSAK